MQCRSGCGACCIAPSISTSMPGMPQGKPGGVRCLHLDENYACQLWGDPARPKVCAAFKAEHEICGDSRADAMQVLTLLEKAS